jgi:uncharacterized membrane protein
MILLLVMRLLHILSGIFWAGAMLFTARFLLPAMQDAGPDGAKVGAALAQRGFLVVMPIVALVTIVSGSWLYWRVSGGFQDSFMRSGMGVTLGIGALCAITAFLVGVTVVRPAMTRAMALAQSAAQASPAERDGMLQSAQALRTRSNAATQVVALFLGLAAAAMALARYIA